MPISLFDEVILGPLPSRGLGYTYWVDGATVMKGIPHESFRFFQLFGHARSPSMEFKEMTKRDAEISLAHELEKLKKTALLPEFQAKLVDKEFDGFKRLFGKFLTSDSHEAIRWDKIEKLPKDAVSFTVNHVARRPD